MARLYTFQGDKLHDGIDVYPVYDSDGRKVAVTNLGRSTFIIADATWYGNSNVGYQTYSQNGRSNDDCLVILREVRAVRCADGARVIDRSDGFYVGDYAVHLPRHGRVTCDASGYTVTIVNGGDGQKPDLTITAEEV